MAAIFCLRLGLGLMASLLVIPSTQLPSRFFRVHFLTVLGLMAVGLVFSLGPSDDAPDPGVYWWAVLLSLAMTFFGSVVWHLEGAPLGRWALVLSVVSLIWTVTVQRLDTLTHPADAFPLIVDDLTSAGVLGSALTAMLIGHSYLMAPAMTLTPLLRMLKILGGCLVVRMVLAGFGLWWWTAQREFGYSETETVIWLAVRWLVGFVAPLILTWMAWETARIRSTQSATGILYVVVIVCFLGELTSQLLLDKTGHIL